MNFVCHHCGELFDEPETEQNGFGHEFGFERYTTARCPFCGDTNFDVAQLCKCCKAEEVDGDNYICKNCRDYLISRFKRFVLGLTAEEMAQLDLWLDGNSITECETWT